MDIQFAWDIYVGFVSGCSFVLLFPATARVKPTWAGQTLVVPSQRLGEEAKPPSKVEAKPEKNEKTRPP